MDSKHLGHLYTVFLKNNGVCTDTRDLKSEQIFFALKGPNFDGNVYAEKAIDEGACLVVVDNEKYNIDKKCFLVEDSLMALQSLARHHRRQFNIPIIGITGSNGKTTTKELMARVLDTNHKVHFTQGNLNNHIGVPQTLLAMPKDTEIAIIEMGANHLGDIAALCDIAEPNFGLITNIGRAHIGEFGSWENIIRTKSELFDFINKNKGTAFINMEDEVLANMSNRFPDGVLYPNDTCTFQVPDPYVTYTDDSAQLHRTHILGTYNFTNIAAAIAVGKYFEVKNAYQAIDEYIPDNNRSQMMKLGSNQIILDAYNANPSSMQAALENLDGMAKNTKIAILGDMKELGDFATKEHQDILKLGAKLDLDYIYTAGQDFCQSRNSSNIRAFKDINELAIWLKNHPISGATVLIKGSRSMEMEQLVRIAGIWK